MEITRADLELTNRDRFYKIKDEAAWQTLITKFGKCKKADRKKGQVIMGGQYYIAKAHKSKDKGIHMLQFAYRAEPSTCVWLLKP